MADYIITGHGYTLFEAYTLGGGTAAKPLSASLLYHTSSEFGFSNADGTTTYVFGSGFVWNDAKGVFTAGSVTHIARYDSEGRYIDDLTGLSGVTAQQLQALIESNSGVAGSAAGNLLLGGDDLLDARDYTGSGSGLLLEGFAGNDVIRGSSLNDHLIGDEGHDRLTGNAGDDMVFGNQGDDRLQGRAGDDMLYGDSTIIQLSGGSDVLRGGSGRDTLDGGSQNDRLSGGTGEDSLTGGSGDDMLTGGRGADTFHFLPFSEPPRPSLLLWGQDVITDFTLGTDHLHLQGADLSAAGWANDEAGNAVLTIDAANSITFVGIDANSVSLDDLLLS